ncbi:uncharacterized protein [Onthophagus taurus]|uniref:uncharacterized protein isoform X2 n=1 Tax=Onthophagus taurus TaxID=166361 RepID=UPI0039BEB45A
MFGFTTILYLITLLMVQKMLFFAGECMSLKKNGQGGLLEGDPAPGRSPGPPLFMDEDTKQEKTGKDCDPMGNSTGTDEAKSLNLTVTHHLFNTDSLVFGVLYQVVISRTSRRTAIGQDLKFSLLSTAGIGENPLGHFETEQSRHVCTSGRLSHEESTVILNWTAEENIHFNKSNVTFTLLYKTESESTVYEKSLTVPIMKDCQLWLKNQNSSIHSYHFPSRDCTCWFPWSSSEHGLVVDIIRLNVPCYRGELHFSGLNVSQHQYAIRSHRQARVCGKLEELSETDRHIYFPPSHTPPFLYVRGNPIFNLNYHLVDYCYNVTFTSRNGSFELKPTGELQCTFKIYLPYGNRIALVLNIGDSTTTGLPSNKDFGKLENVDGSKCDGLYTELLDGDNVWSHCTRHGDAERKIEAVSTENRVVLKIRLRSGTKGDMLSLKMRYRAEPIEEIVRTCEFGWVAYRQFCISPAEDMKLPWIQAEMECGRRGGHLVSIRNVDAQNIIEKILLNSPGYRDYNAYWIGASDKMHEGDFHWTDGLPFSFTNWFSGWPQHSNYNRQPNDDGLSDQDCVEIRRVYLLPSATPKLTAGFMWNDRDCATPNYFFCEKLQNDEPLEESWPPDCNKSIILSRQQQRAVVSSPGFPRQYPDNADCYTDVTAPKGYRLVLDFEELVLENEPICSYDFLEITESIHTNNTSNIIAVPATLSLSAPVFNNSETGRRLCGDWSSKLKLLRYVSRGSKLKLRFNSDYSHHFGGFKVRISMENALQCADDRFQIFNNSCYLFVSYPAVTWNTALQICHGIKAQLSSILTSEEEDFVTTNIRKTSEYRTTAGYWLGAQLDNAGKFSWIDGNELGFTKWLTEREDDEENDINRSLMEPLCLATQWTPSRESTIPSGFYWKSLKCSSIGGYVCKRPRENIDPKLNYNRTVNGTEGELTTPNYPNNYYDNLDFSVRIRGPERTRIVLHFERIDLEPQLECLYDFVQVRSRPNKNHARDDVKFCGRYDTDMTRYDFVSQGNEAELIFHSDYSITAGGFYLRWYAVDTTGCPEQTLTAKEGIIQSPNYPNFLLGNLDCTFTVLAPPGKRIWLEFLDFEIDDSLGLRIGDNTPIIKPFTNPNILTDGTFLSIAEKLVIKLKSKSSPKGRGFKAIYRSLLDVNEEKVIEIHNGTSGTLLHLNYPDRPPPNATITHHFVAPIGHIVSIEMYNVRVNTAERGGCAKNNSIEIYDSYADVNGTQWILCHDEGANSEQPDPPLVINSFLNTLYVKQNYDLIGDVFINATIRVKFDDGYFKKILKYKNDIVESCDPNPCQHDGKCIATVNGKRTCQCQKYFTGLFCALTQCDLEPCVFGTCELTETNFKCRCKSGYLGATCEQKRKPCQDNPCESRGICTERGNSFHCQCHAWWEGTRCERRMMHIPYKPLSERMLHEPFWLGLMTVTVVMGVIGLVWCAKRHFPEKIEKLLAEEDDRSRSGVSSLRSSSVREQLAAASAAASAAGVATSGSSTNPGTGVPRSLFGRLGSPSPKKKRNNSTPTKKNAAEKKQILQQLISPAASSQNTRKVSLGDLIQMSERKLKDDDNKEEIKETKLTVNKEISAGHLSLVDPKLEKKVTFARLLSKVSQEMSSGSDLEMGNRLSCAFTRPASTPPSPGANVRSPNSTSSNQGSDSLTSSDLAIPTALSSSISDLMYSRKASLRLPAKQKPASADSILAMFRNFSSSSAGANLSPSLRISPSTTPTASSPQDDVAGDDESSTSSIHTPVSFSSGPSESPIMQRQQQQQQYGTIEVPVLDALSAHKSSPGSSNFLHPPTILLEIPSAINKCLSPIREMPTPLPSPMPSQAATPVPLRRTNFADNNATDSDDRISIEIPNISISDGDEDDMHGIQDIAIDPQGEDGLIQEEVAVMHQGTPSPVLKIKSRPHPIGQSILLPLVTVSEEPTPPPTMIIPTLVIQTPSPTHKKAPNHFGKLGSPPPRLQQEEFQFPGSSNKSRKMLKEFDKPTSLDLPCAPPLITITCNLSEAESDTDSISPAIKPGLNVPPGMTYLSPFSMVTRGDHMASESNLSSSGYSSMASPGPSRCGSSNPLCPSEMEDPGGSGSNLHPPLRRHSPLIRTSTSPPDCGSSQSNQDDSRRGHHTRGRSDSETLSDDPLIESNDEGIGTDHIDEKIEDGEVKSAKELEVFISDKKIKLDLPLTTTTQEEINSIPSGVMMKTLQLPSIIVQCGDTLSLEKSICSPVSSRSESPLSDRTTGVGRFSPQFYGGHKDLLPFTDSDGLYDFPSSDKVNSISGGIHQQHRKSTGRKRGEKRMTRSSKTPSPTKGNLNYNYHLELPKKEAVVKLHSLPRKTSPKRRLRTSKMVSSSSSSESITSAKEMRLSSSSPSPETIRWASSVDCFSEKRVKTPEASGEETGDDAHSVMLPKSDQDLYRHKKISRLRTISHQIRFLRRIEQSLRKKERVKSSSDSFNSGEDSPRATSPLLQTREPKIEIRKSSSSGKLQSSVNYVPSSSSSRHHRYGNFKKGELLIPETERAWKKVMVTGNGHSD